MSAPADAALASDAATPAEGPWLIAGAALLAMWLQGVNISLPNAAAPHIQGTLSMSDDEIGWIFSSYIAASAATMPTARWLAGRLGRKTVLLVSLSVFAAALVLVARATTPLGFVAARVLQGAAAGLIGPLSLGILLEATPPARQGQARLAATVTAMAGILSGPGLGGWVAEAWGWPAIFRLSLAPVAAVLLTLSLYLPEKRTERSPFDVVGAGALTIGLIGLQMLLDRGERLEWFASRECRLEAATSAAGLLLFLARVVTSRAHFVDKGLLRDRNFVVATALYFVFGFVLLPTVALTSPMLEELLGYPVDTTGYMTIPRSLALIAGLVLTWPEWRRLDDRLLLAGGMALVVWANARMLGYSPLMDWRPVVVAGVLQGAGLGAMMPPLSRIALGGLAPALRAEGGDVFNLARLYGSTLGIAVVQVLFYDNTQAVHMALAARLPADRVADPAGAALAALNESVTGQAAMVAMIDQFKLLMLVMLAAGPLVLLLRRPSAPASIPGAAR